MKLARRFHFTPHLRRSGFTLIEAMIVVAIIGILAAIAYPSYLQYVIRSNRSVAQQFMLQIANKQEQYLLSNRNYASTVSALNLSAPPELSTRYTFSIAVNAGPPLTHTVTAAVVAGGPQASDGNLTLDSLGNKTPADKWTK